MGTVRLFRVTALSLGALTACAGAVVGSGGSSRLAIALRGSLSPSRDRARDRPRDRGRDRHPGVRARPASTPSAPAPWLLATLRQLGPALLLLQMACPTSVATDHLAAAGSGDAGVTDAGPDGAPDDAGHGPCWVCACETPDADGGCVDTGCVQGEHAVWSAFCSGMPALYECAECIADRCGVADPKDCK